MKFLVSRASQGPASREPPCPGAQRGPEVPTWPGEYEWYVELHSLEELIAFLHQTGGALGLFSPEEGEQFPTIEIFDEDEADE